MLSGRDGNEDAREGTSSQCRELRRSSSSELYISESNPGGVTCSARAVGGDGFVDYHPEYHKLSVILDYSDMNNTPYAKTGNPTGTGMSIRDKVSRAGHLRIRTKSLHRRTLRWDSFVRRSSSTN